MSAPARTTRADRVLEAATAGREVAWRGAPGVGAALLAEVAGIGVVAIALGVLGLLVFVGFVALAPAPSSPGAAPDPVAVGGFVAFVVAVLAVGPPLVLDALELSHTRYAATRDGLVLVSGVLFPRATLVRPPFSKVERKPGVAGTVDLGECEHAPLDAAGRASAAASERLWTRLRGLGLEADRAAAVLASLAPARA